MADDRPPLESFVRSSGRPPLESFLKSPAPSRGEEAVSAVTDIPSEIGREYGGAAESIKGFGEWARGPGQQQFNPLDKGSWSNVWEGIKKGAGAAGSAAYLGTGIGPAITGAAKSVIGHGLEAVQPTPGGYEQSKEKATLPLMAMMPGARPMAPPKPATGPFDVTLPRGSIPATGIGEAGKERVGAFTEQTTTDIDKARNIAMGRMHPGGQVIADTPNLAGQRVSEAIQKEAARTHAQTKSLWQKATAQPGDVHPSVFQSFGPEVKMALTQKGIVIDPLLTPFANKAADQVQDIERLFIQNRASPQGPPNPQQIVGVNLQGVDQMRKLLGSFNKSAFAAAQRSGDWADYNATKNVLDFYNDKVSQALKNPQLFTGDPRAGQAYDLARAATHDEKATFQGRNGTAAGIIQAIIKGKKGDGPATANAVADFLYGAKGVNPTDLNIAAAKAARKILGPQSPAWIGAQQGMMRRVLTPHPEVPLEPEKERQYLLDFLHGNGKDMAVEMLSPDQRAMWQSYADMLHEIQITKVGLPQHGFFHAVVDKLKHGLNFALLGAFSHGGDIHGVVSAVPRAAITGAAERVMGTSEARNIAKQLPLRIEELAKWRIAVQKAQRTSNPQDRFFAMTALANLVRGLNGMGVDVGQTPQAEPQPEKKPAYGGPME